MSTENPQQPPSSAGGEGQPSEEELRAAYEAELSRITATDMMAQAAVSLLNIGARRLGPPGADPAEAAAAGRDLEQARDAIDGARALLGILERTIAQELGPLRDALSRLQMAYASEVQGAGASAPAPPQTPPSPPSAPPPAGAGQAPGAEQPETGSKGAGPGPAESSGRLWVPGR